LNAESIAFWQAYAPMTRLINEYGPTETVVGCCVYEVGEADFPSGRVPIGRPTANTQLYVLSEQMHPVPMGVLGELYIGGDSVARGYLNRPDISSEKFVPHPFSKDKGARLYKTGDLVRFRDDGILEFLGRTDDQIKIRGFRVELGEIEKVVEEHPSVAKSVVIARENNYQNKRLIAYVIPHPQNAFAARQMLRLKSEGMLKNRKLNELPNGMTIVQANLGETDYLYNEIFNRKVYLKNGITLADGDCVFDVGANIGLFSLFVGQICNNATIYAFEPIPSTFELLRLNTALYDLNVKLFSCGLSNEVKNVTFTHYPRLSVMSGRFTDQKEDKGIVKSYVLNRQLVN